ncbi:MAG: radical SAM protein, partial [Planctomycetes bacterium]|nr:radical SAM protein [Planctomycetota bacterium]
MKTLEPMLMPYIKKDVPHAVLEVNQKCNIVCRACYKHKFDYTKPLEQVKKEFDLLLSMRNLNTITLAGGEPTLHPDLSEIIRYITKKGILVQILSNGLALTDKLLRQYKKAGLKEILLHIDSFQTRPDMENIRCEKDLNKLRNKIAEKINRNGIISSLELTLYRNALPEFNKIVYFVLSNPKIYRLLITCCHDMERTAYGFKGGLLLGTKYPSVSETLKKKPNEAKLDD